MDLYYGLLVAFSGDIISFTMLRYLDKFRKQAFFIPGEDINLRPVRRSELPAIRRWLKDKELVRLAFGVEAEGKVLDKIAHDYYHDVVSGLKFVLGIEDKKGKLAGFIRYTLREDGSVARIGIMIGEKQNWNKGMGTQGMRLLLKYLFDIIGIEKIELDTADFNQRAQRCFEKVGFKRTGEFSDVDFLQGSFSHRIYMHLTRDDYRAENAEPDNTQAK
ncbi:MAG: GNAT family N-acetyltransferase [Chloroflexi bacterium]|nr:GNAT family N-acetyltransferase [Chloroflexota bacterium]